MKLKKVLFVLLLAISSSSCGATSGQSSGGDSEPPIHEHTFSDEWKYNETHHWHPSTCGHNVISDKEEHTFSIWSTEKEATYTSEGEESRFCYVCNYKQTRPIEMLKYSVTFDLDGGTSSQKVSQFVSSFSEIEFSFDCKKSNYNFRGWSLNGQTIYDEEGNLLCEPEMMPNMVFVAQYSNTIKVKIVCKDLELNTIPVCASFTGDGEYNFYSTIKLTVEPYPNYKFEGWYNTSNKDLSFIYSVSVNSSIYDITIYAKFTKYTDEERNYKFGLEPLIDLENKTVTYGLYPYGVIKYPTKSDLEKDIESCGTPINDNLVFYNEEYYYKYISDFTDKNHDIYTGQTYWFKCKAINWNILENDNGNILLISESRIDAQQFHNSNEGIANDYSNSFIRHWLNDVFYNRAFLLDDSHLVNHENGDKVKLLSKSDYENEKYGLTSVDSRKSSRTSWSAFAKHNYSYDDTFTWTTTPSDSSTTGAYYYNENNNSFDISSCGAKFYIRPCIRIKI